MAQRDCLVVDPGGDAGRMSIVDEAHAKPAHLYVVGRLAFEGSYFVRTIV